MPGNRLLMKQLDPAFRRKVLEIKYITNQAMPTKAGALSPSRTIRPDFFSSYVGG